MECVHNYVTFTAHNIVCSEGCTGKETVMEEQGTEVCRGWGSELPALCSSAQ